ncbi:unnamed protein product, partial [Mesorhabditis spiculigera]
MAAKMIRFIGHPDVNAEGKYLWEILAQLRKFGVGRVVTKSEWGRKWPDQPSFLKIARVAPTMDRWLFGGKMWAEWTFRGRNLGIYEFGQDLNRADWKLIHRHEEQAFTNCDHRQMPEVDLPDSFPLPPLQVHLMKRISAARGKEWPAEHSRMALHLSVDPELAHMSPIVKQVTPARKGKSLYDEVDPAKILDFYGKELPFRVEAWATEPAAFSLPFTPEKCKGRLREIE